MYVCRFTGVNKQCVGSSTIILPSLYKLFITPKVENEYRNLISCMPIYSISEL